MKSPLLLAVVVTCAAATLAPDAGRADWVVLRDGRRLETRGPWEQRGRTVVFTGRDGKLASLRLEEVDIEASTAASTARAADSPGATAAPVPAPASASIGSAAAAAREARRAAGEPVVTLRDGDVARSDSEAAPVVAARRIVLYSTSWCPWCRKTKALLDLLGRPYVERDIERDPAARREMEALAGRGAGVPVLDIGGRVVRGFAPEQIELWVQALFPVEPPAEEGGG